MVGDKYICWKRIYGKHVSGEVNIPRGTRFVVDKNGMIVHEGTIIPICKEYSQTMHKYLAFNNDSRGLERGELIFEMKKKLGQVKNRYSRFVLLASDSIANTYRKLNDDADREGFYWDFRKLSRASVYDLEHLLNIAIKMY